MQAAEGIGGEQQAVQGLGQAAVVHVRQRLGQQAEQLALLGAAGQGLEQRSQQILAVLLQLRRRDLAQHLVQRLLVGVGRGDDRGQRGPA
ncbi:hypothetical protein D3C78_1045980 [compost metagenome]